MQHLFAATSCEESGFSLKFQYVIRIKRHLPNLNNTVV